MAAGGAKHESVDNRHAAKRTLADAEAKLRRLQDAIAAGVDPTALVEAINQAQAEREMARSELANSGDTSVIGAAEIQAMIDSLGNVGAKLKYADDTDRAALYAELGVAMRYEPTNNAVQLQVAPRVVSERVRGRSCSLFTRLEL